MKHALQQRDERTSKKMPTTRLAAKLKGETFPPVTSFQSVLVMAKQDGEEVAVAVPRTVRQSV